MTEFMGPCSCCDKGVGWFCKNLYCCMPCTFGNAWEAYEMPGGCPVGCLCGQMICCQFMLRSKMAKEHGIEDGAMAFVCPLCCGECNNIQMIMTANREKGIEAFTKAGK